MTKDRLLEMNTTGPSPGGVMSGLTFGVLMGAADYLEHYGWCQGSFGYYEGPACAMGAVNVALGGGEPRNPGVRVSDEVARALGIELVVTSWNDVVTSWNDARGRTKTEVVTRLRAAAYRVLRGDDAPLLNEYAPC